jgi:hypothetical protein
MKKEISRLLLVIAAKNFMLKNKKDLSSLPAEDCLSFLNVCRRGNSGIPEINLLARI